MGKEPKCWQASCNAQGSTATKISLVVRTNPTIEASFNPGCTLESTGELDNLAIPTLPIPRDSDFTGPGLGLEHWLF